MPEIQPKRRIIQQNFGPEPKPVEAPSSEQAPAPRAVSGPNLFSIELGQSDREALFRTGQEAFASVERLSDYLTPELAKDEIDKVVEQIMTNQDKYLDLTKDQLKIVVFNAIRTRGYELLKHFDEADLPELKVRKREEARAEKARIEQEELEISNSAQSELKQVIESLLLGDLSPVQEQTLKYFYQIYVENKKDPEVAKQFPKSTRDQRYQWKARGIQMVLPHVSENTKHYLGWRTKRKFATASEIYEYSKYFLQEIGDLS